MPEFTGLEQAVLTAICEEQPDIADQLGRVAHPGELVRVFYSAQAFDFVRASGPPHPGSSRGSQRPFLGHADLSGGINQLGSPTKAAQPVPHPTAKQRGYQSGHDNDYAKKFRR